MEGDKVKIAELKNRLSEMLRRVQAGEEILVTDRDRPVARIIPYKARPMGLTIRPAKKPFAEVRRKRPAPANWPVDSLSLLLEERQNWR